MIAQTTPNPSNVDIVMYTFIGIIISFSVTYVESWGIFPPVII